MIEEEIRDKDSTSFPLLLLLLSRTEESAVGPMMSSSCGKILAGELQRGGRGGGGRRVARVVW